MSTAHKCDRCATLFMQERGTVTLGEVCVTDASGKTMDAWSDVDFCPACSRELLKFIGPALDGLDSTKP